MKILSVLGAVGILFVIMGIAVFAAVLGRGVVLCVQRGGGAGRTTSKTTNLPETNPAAAALERLGG